MAKVIYADGTEIEVRPKNGNDFQLEELYEHVECSNIEIVEAFDGRLIVLDGEGKLYGKALNRKATDLYKYGANDNIVGTVVVCETYEVE